MEPEATSLIGKSFWTSELRAGVVVMVLVVVAICFPADIR
jgi:hypothetical protein